MTVSWPPDFAASSASKTTVEGLHFPPSRGLVMSTSSLSAQTPSWSTAAARNVSAAASMTFLPCWFLSLFASLAMVVVLPAPFTPTTSSTQMSSFLGSRGWWTFSRISRILDRRTSLSISASVSPFATISRIGSSSTVVVEIPTSAISSCSSSSSMVSSSTSPVIRRLNCCCIAFRLFDRLFDRLESIPSPSAATDNPPLLRNFCGIIERPGPNSGRRDSGRDTRDTRGVTAPRVTRFGVLPANSKSEVAMMPNDTSRKEERLGSGRRRGMVSSGGGGYACVFLFFSLPKGGEGLG
mmetsp:Transcript_27058/g.47853  ORF Transcript_27058/g.47853 Transcript_27058/m.47853 type:complete len:296 (-) Transcript_27058:6-893(-)